MRKDFYVYFHKDRDGKTFYVGKGTGRRAWQKDRHPVWRKYVSERLGGYYDVEIFKEGLTEAEAEDLESELIGIYGEQLVNWINPRRQFDLEALEKFHRLRDANREFVEETKAIESQDPDRAIARYRQALQRMREYESLTLERGLIAELGDGPDWGDPNILNRLTICLQKLKRYAEIVEDADSYFADFPSARGMSVGKQICKRVEKARKKLEKGNT